MKQVRRTLIFTTLVTTVLATLAACSSGPEHMQNKPKAQWLAASSGIFECEAGPRDPIYTFDLEAQSTVVLDGLNPGIEFVDMDTGKQARVFMHGLEDYSCTRVESTG